MKKSEAQNRYDQYSAYLNDLLKKHELGEGITYEDLQHSWKHVLKLCKDNQQEPLDDLKMLHESQLSQYKKAAQKYYESILKSYEAPPLHSSQITATEYINYALSKVQIQEKWHVDYPDVEAWLWNPLRNLLSKWYNTVKTISKKKDSAPRLPQITVANSADKSSLSTATLETSKKNDAASLQKNEDTAVVHTSKDQHVLEEEKKEVLDHESECEEENEDDDDVDEDEEAVEQKADDGDRIQINVISTDESKSNTTPLTTKVLLRSSRSQQATDQQVQLSNKRKLLDESTSLKKGKLTEDSSNILTKKKSHRGRGRGKGRGRGRKVD